MRRVLPMKLLLAVLLAACVTVNVYFPAAAAQSAADQVIDTIMKGPSSEPAQGGPGSTQSKPQGSTVVPSRSVLVAAVGTVLNALVPAAQAQANANLDISTPEVRAIVQSMAARNGSLRGYFASGAIGLTSDGHIELRDANAVPLPERANAKRLVAEDNRDRDALYGEVAKANGHPEWKGDIQATFARRWIAKADPGTWYQDGGAWKQK